MKTVIIIHGRPDKDEYFDPTKPKPENAHWLPWLKRELEANGYFVQVPAMPVPYEPDYESWKKVFEELTLDTDTVLVGHSRGGAFLLHWLSDHDMKVGKVLLVAPSITPNHPVEIGFSEFAIDTDLIAKTDGVTMFYSTDDEEEILESVAHIKEAIKDINVIELHDAGHFTSGDGYDEFPELLKEIVR